MRKIAAASFLLELGTLNDIKKLIKVYLESHKTNNRSIEDIYGLINLCDYIDTVIKQNLEVFTKLTEDLDEENIFVINLELDANQYSLFCQTTLLLEQIKQDPVFSKQLKNLRSFRELLNEFFYTEHTFVNMCHNLDRYAIEAAIASWIDQEVREHRLGDQEISKIYEQIKILDNYKELKNPLTITPPFCIGFVYDAYFGTEYLLNQICSEDFNEAYADLESLALNYSALISLIDRIINSYNGYPEYADQVLVLKSALQILSQPWQRTMRYPMLLNAAKDEKRIDKLAQFYAEHDSARSEKLQATIENIKSKLNDLEKKAGDLNEQRRRLEAKAESKKPKPPKSIDGSITLTQTREGTLGALSSFFRCTMYSKLSKPDQELLKACQAGSLEKVILAVNQGANLNARDHHLSTVNYTPLMHACQNSHLTIVRFLVNYKSDDQQIDLRAQCSHRKCGPAAIHLAIACDNHEIVDLLCETDPKVRLIKEATNKTLPLFLAINRGHHDTVKVLLQHFAKEQLTHKNSCSQDAIDVAIQSKAYDIIPLLIDTMRRFQNQDLIHLASKKVDQAFGQARGFFGMLFASPSRADEKLLRASADNDLEAVQTALSEGADINARDVGAAFANYTPLIHAARNNNPGVVDFLLTYDTGPKANECLQTYFNCRNTALHWAAREGHVRIVNLLIQHRGHRQLTIQEDEFGYTPLHWAVENNHIEVIKSLLYTGCNQQLKALANDQVSNAFRVAINNSNWKAAILVLNAAKDQNLIDVVSTSIGYAYYYLQLKLLSHQRNKVELFAQAITAWKTTTKDQIMLLTDLLGAIHKYAASPCDLYSNGELRFADNGELYNKWTNLMNDFTNADDATRTATSDAKPVCKLQLPIFQECEFSTCIQEDQEYTSIKLKNYNYQMLALLPGKLNKIAEQYLPGYSDANISLEGSELEIMQRLMSLFIQYETVYVDYHNPLHSVKFVL